MKLDKFTHDILSAPNIRYLLNDLHLEVIEETERHGGVYRAIIYDSTAVGIAQ